MALDRDEVNARVMEIAERLLDEGGAENLQARTIAREAGVSVGSVYNLFGDLGDLHRAVNLRLLDRLGEAGKGAMMELQARGVTDTRERLLALAAAYLRFVERHSGSWAALLAFNRSRRADAQPEWYTARLDTLFTIIAAVLGDGGYALDDRQRAVAARALWSSVHGIVTSGYVGAGGADARAEIWGQIVLLVETFTRGLDRLDGPAQ